MKSKRLNQDVKSIMSINKTIAAAIGILMFNLPVHADQKIQDDLVVVGSICAGFDCATGEAFGFDTIRLKENNLRIRFIDSSSSSSFPTRDWQITINDSANGGVNKFSIENLDNETVPFTILDNAPNNSIYVAASGNVGFGTTTPLVDLAVKSGNSPTIRLSQDGSSGFAEQEWDIGGNETNFFVRDVTFGSQLPLRIVPSAPNGSLHIAADGDVGFRTTTPDGQFDVAHVSDANNHAFLISPASYVGVNIDNGFLPRGWFDVQTTGGKSQFMVKTDGKVGIGMGTSGVPNGLLDIQDTAGNSKFLLQTDGKIGVGTATPAAALHLVGTSGLIVTDTDTGALTNQAKVHFKGGDGNTKLAIEETLTTIADRGLLELTNYGGSRINFNNTSGSAKASNWRVATEDTSGSFIITRIGSGKVELEIDIAGNIITSGTTVHTSDKNRKYNISSIDEKEILEKITNLPISTWTYDSEQPNIRHIGPMAQDFRASFGFGINDTTIAEVDINGVALASIKALNSKLLNKNKQVKKLDAQVKELDEKNKILTERLQRLESMVYKRG